MDEPIWITDELGVAIHERQLSEHGGAAGIRDEGLLDSALARPRQQWTYGGGDVELPMLAAAYAFGIARNHPFMDGNKRTAAVTCEVFLELNGYVLVATDIDLYPMYLALASGELSEEAFAEWLRANSRPVQISEPGSGYA